MGIQVDSVKAICSKCGTAFGGLRGHFPACYSNLYKGVGHTTVCRNCIEDMFSGYLSQCNNVADAVRQVCRKLDLYWSRKIFDIVERKSTARSIMLRYIAKINTLPYVGKSYDDTLSDEGTLWDFRCNMTRESVDGTSAAEPSAAQAVNDENSSSETPSEEISEDIIAFWGYGLDTQQYIQLEQRRKYWMSRLPDDMEFDIGTEVIIKQICSLELDINRDRATGRSVDKSVNSLIALLGSARLKPAQKKETADAELERTPLGVWAKRWESKRPIPKYVDPDYEDKNNIIRYITTWFLGHLCKMLNIKNSYNKLYEDEIAKLRVKHPEYKEDDDETLIDDVFAEDEDDGGEPDGSDS